MVYFLFLHGFLKLEYHVFETCLKKQVQRSRYIILLFRPDLADCELFYDVFYSEIKLSNCSVNPPFIDCQNFKH